MGQPQCIVIVDPSAVDLAILRMTGARVLSLRSARAQAQIESRTMWQRRDITGGDVWSGNQTYACFGLGDSTNVTTLRIEWPSGTMQELTNVSADQILNPSAAMTTADIPVRRVWQTSPYLALSVHY